MKLLKSIAISFSLYSKIPMPIFKWDEDNYKHAIDYLPLIGMVIGAVSGGVICACDRWGIPVFVTTMLLTLIPLAVTGGFHVDGFMDVQDALHCFKDREKKLEIMKDPHIGAFAVIAVGMLSILWLAALYIVVDAAFHSDNFEALWAYTAIFSLARVFCGGSSILFKNAKKEGMLFVETGKSGTTDILILVVFGVISFLFMVKAMLLGAAVCGICMALFTLWYKALCYREFGGVTGDTAGFFVTAGETLMVVVLAVLSVVVI